jgi:hypothetical protein
LYGVSFPYFEKLSAIYSKEGADGFGEAVTNLANEIVAKERDRQKEDMMLREAPRRSVDTQSHTQSGSCDTSISSKRQKKFAAPRKASQSDPIVIMLEDVSSQPTTVTQHVGTTALVARREAALLEKAVHDDPNMIMKQNAIDELSNPMHRFTGSEISDDWEIDLQDFGIYLLE